MTLGATNAYSLKEIKCIKELKTVGKVGKSMTKSEETGDKR